MKLVESVHLIMPLNMFDAMSDRDLKLIISFHLTMPFSMFDVMNDRNLKLVKSVHLSMPLACLMYCLADIFSLLNRFF